MCSLYPQQDPFSGLSLKHLTGYFEEETRECAELLVDYHTKAVESDLKAVHHRYSELEYGAVAHLTLLKASTPLHEHWFTKNTHQYNRIGSRRF